MKHPYITGQGWVIMGIFLLGLSVAGGWFQWAGGWLLGNGRRRLHGGGWGGRTAGGERVADTGDDGKNNGEPGVEYRVEDGCIFYGYWLAGGWEQVAMRTGESCRCFTWPWITHPLPGRLFKTLPPILCPLPLPLTTQLLSSKIQTSPVIVLHKASPRPSPLLFIFTWILIFPFIPCWECCPLCHKGRSYRPTHVRLNYLYDRYEGHNSLDMSDSNCFTGVEIKHEFLHASFSPLIAIITTVNCAKSTISIAEDL